MRIGIILNFAASVTTAHTADPIGEIYSQHHRWLLRWLRGKLQCTEHAADLAQDTFLRLLAAPPQQRQTLREPRAYLTTVARRLLTDHYRRQSLEQAWLDTLAQMPELLAQSPEERLLVLETLHRLDTMLDDLPPAVRSAFLLSHLEGLAHAEIAARLGVSERTVKRYLVQAFERCILLVA